MAPVHGECGCEANGVFDGVKTRVKAATGSVDSAMPCDKAA